MDHEEVFKLYDEYREYEKVGNYEGIKRVFYELLEYLTFHFIREEELMKAISYPEILAHQHHHFQMQEIYLSLVQPVLNSTGINAEVQKFMELLKSHIEKHDSKISEFLEKRNK
jgi:hemerythrin-like metal-binding protein